MILAECLRTADDVARELMETERIVDLLQLKAARLAAALAETKVWDAAGFNSPGDWMRFHCHLTNNVAWDRIAVGKRLGQMPESEQALYDGDIGYAHLRVMARTAETVGANAFDESKLLPLARENSPGKFYYKCQHYRHAVDAKAYSDEQSELVENCRLSLSTAEDGCLLINGVLDPVGGAAVRTALEPLARRSGVADDRGLEQRYADALVELAHVHLRGGTRTRLEARRLGTGPGWPTDRRRRDHQPPRRPRRRHARGARRHHSGHPSRAARSCSAAGRPIRRARAAHLRRPMCSSPRDGGSPRLTRSRRPARDPSRRSRQGRGRSAGHLRRRPREDGCGPSSSRPAWVRRDGRPRGGG